MRNDSAYRFQNGIDTWPGKHVYSFYTYQGRQSGSKQQLDEVMRRMGRSYRILRIQETHHVNSQMHGCDIYYEVIE